MEQNSTPEQLFYKDLAEVRKKMNPAYKGKSNGRGMYPSIEEIYETGTPVLAEFGFTIIPYPETRENVTGITVIFAHISGHTIKTWLAIARDFNQLDNRDWQKLGGAETYWKRRIFQSMAGIIGSDDIRMDEEYEYVQEEKKTAQNKIEKQDHPKPAIKYLSEDQLDMLCQHIGDDEEIAKDIIKVYGGLSKIPKDEFKSSIERILHLKRLKE